MRKFFHFFMWFVFLVTLGFAGGGLVLLYAAVPLEAWLQHHTFLQPTVNHVMAGLVIFWVAIGLVLSIVYWRLCLRRRAYTLAIVLMCISLFGAIGMFHMFMSTDSPIMASFQGKDATIANSRLMFGAYPDDAKLKELRSEGYTNDITLLSPDIPFENSLLTEEKANGASLGIHVYSFPMLPWVGDNTKSLASIKDLVDSHPNQRFYIHCYLGKHRAVMVERMLQGSVTSATPAPLPPRLTRGLLYPYEHQRILLGPFPTNVEWFDLLESGQIKEVISTLQPTNPSDNQWIDEAKRECQENNIKFTQMPLDPNHPDPAAVQGLTSYVAKLHYPVFVFDFSNGKRFWTLDEAFSKLH